MNLDIAGNRIRILRNQISPHDVRIHLSNVNQSSNQESLLAGPLYFQNWASIHDCTADVSIKIQEKEDLQRVIHQCKEGDIVKVVGSGHSPSRIAMADRLDSGRGKSYLVRLKGTYNQILSIDGLSVRVQSGITLNELNEKLNQHGLAMRNLGSISEQTISGAISTGTHGTGIEFGNLCTMIESMEIIDGLGNFHQLKKGDDYFQACVCGLGVCGIVTEVTIRVEKAYKLHSIQKPAKFDFVLQSMNEMIRQNEHFRFWWFPHTEDCITWTANRTTKPITPEPSFYQKTMNFINDRVVGYHLFEFGLLMTKLIPSITQSLNQTYFDYMFSKDVEVIDTSYKIFNFDCLFKQYVNEWAIPIENTEKALQKLKSEIDKQGFNVHLPIEVRFVRQDDIWMSPCYQQDVCYIGIIMYRPYGLTIQSTFQYFRHFEKIMLEFGGRPHWAKEFNLTFKDFQKMYPKLDQFNLVRNNIDPKNLFLNRHTFQILNSPSHDVLKTSPHRPK